MQVWKRCHRLLFSIASVVVFGLASGCANPLLYNEARDKQGQQAKAAVGEVDLVASVDALQGKFKALADLEAAAQKDRSALSRNLVITELVNPPTTFAPAVTVQDRYVDLLLEPRLNELGGTVRVDAAADELGRQAASKLRVLSAKAGASVATCADAVEKKNSGTLLTGMSPLQRAMITALLNDAVAFCQKVANAAPPAPLTGEIAMLRAELKKQQDAIATERNSLKKQRDKVDKAAAKASEPDAGKTPSEQLQSAAGKLQEALAAIEAAAKVADLKALTAAKAAARYEALDLILKALSSGTTDLNSLKADEQRAVLVARFIPSIWRSR